MFDDKTWSLQSKNSTEKKTCHGAEFLINLLIYLLFYEAESYCVALNGMELKT